MKSKGRVSHHAVWKRDVVDNINDTISENWRGSYMVQTENVQRYIEDPSKIKGIALNPSLEDLLNVMNEVGARSILDVGCNAGYLYDWLCKYYDHPFEYIGVDIDAEMIKEARELHDDQPKFMQEDLFDLDVRADVVFCSRVLIHLPDFERAMRVLYDACLKAAVVTLKVAKQEQCSVYALVDTATKAETGETWFLRTVTEKMIAALNIDYELHTSRKYSTVVMRRGDV